MAVNLASKYSSVVDERFSIASVTNIAFNRDYDWLGVQTVNVYSIETAPMNDYARTGANRYGTPAELQDTTQELKLTQDRAFTFTIDRGNDIDQMNIKGAGRALRRQLDEVVIPELDTYRLAQLVANAGKTEVAVATATNAYQLFLKGQEALGEAKVPAVGRVAYVTYSYFNMLKLDPSFVKQGDMSQAMLVTGALGMVDNVPLIPVPQSYLPANVQFVIVNPLAACAPVKLSDFTIHENPPGINGNLVEGRLYYDAFVLSNKQGAIYVSSAA